MAGVPEVTEVSDSDEGDVEHVPGLGSDARDKYKPQLAKTSPAMRERAEAFMKTDAWKVINDFHNQFHIGWYVMKLPTLWETLERQLGMYSIDTPMQITYSSRSIDFTNVSDDDITRSAAISKANPKLRWFVHAPHVFNLGRINDATTASIRHHLEVTAAAGGRGVVFHVAKSVEMTPAVALANMKANILAGLPFATPTCPILIETPAGQGSELLRTQDEFLGWITTEFQGDPRVGICIDTCHVWAAGNHPVPYLKSVLEHPETRKLLKLVHYNNSREEFGSRKDRHQQIEGKIPIEDMVAIAQLCNTGYLNEHNRKVTIPMVTE